MRAVTVVSFIAAQTLASWYVLASTDTVMFGTILPRYR
jgi:hypothetical protein